MPTDKNDPFAAYKMPLGLTKTVDVPLPGTPAVFTVILPGTMNEDFNMSLMAKLGAQPDEEGNVKFDALLFSRMRRDMFFDTCIEDATGLPVPMTPAEFFEAYPLAKRHLWDIVTDMASKADEEAQAALEKLSNLSNGSSSGTARKTNTTRSSKRGSKLTRAAQT